MGNDAKTQTKRMHPLLVAIGFNPNSPFKIYVGRGTRWILAILAVLFSGIPFLGIPIASAYGWIPDKFQDGPWPGILLVAYLVAIFVTLGCGANVSRKEFASFVFSNREAPEAKDLLTYIAAFRHCDEKVQAQAVPILCDLLGRLSEDELAFIPVGFWSDLCPGPQKTPTGYYQDSSVDLSDCVLVAGFTAIRRLKRVAWLPTVQGWRSHLKTGHHSDAFVLAFEECYESLRNHQANLPDSSTLLRPSSGEATTPDILLHPIADSHASDTGEQLLRASLEQDPIVSDRSKTCLPAEK